MSKIFSPGLLGIGILAVLAGLTGTYVVRSVMQQPPRREAPRTVVVPLATIDLPEGRVLTMGDVGLYSLTPAEIKERNLNLTDSMSSPEQIIGRRVKSAIAKGQPFLSSSLFLEGTRPSLADKLKPGMRTFMLLVSKERLGGLAIGNHVDVLFRSTPTRVADRSNEQPIPEVTLTLMRDIEILDIYEAPAQNNSRNGGRRVGELDLRLRNQGPPPLQVTLAVTPAQALRLQAIQGKGDLSLTALPEKTDEQIEAARANARAESKAAPSQLTLSDILELPPPPAGPVVFETEIFRKTARSVNVYSNGKLVRQVRSIEPTVPAPQPAIPANSDNGTPDNGATPDQPVPQPSDLSQR
ncbi:MAG: Flp pilus assembly protein CpaB [Planctomycetes bacterium]|nr:Flp pilus assembly protein CpaB [Planctomycetota bacterium]